MVSESQPESSDAADPFAGYSTLSLFSRALTSSMAAADPAPPAGDIDSLHSYLTSRALRRPETLLEQAKTILDSSLETLMTDNISTTEHHSATEALDVAAKENPQERRPALGRKRAQFSLRTNSSQPEVTLEPSVDIDQLQDPEEYFLAMEKLENTKKELQKYRGAVLMDLDPNVPSMTQRRRRPGLERNSATFKHLYSTLPTDDHNSPLSSLETSAREVQIPFCGKMQTENADLDTTSPDGKSGSRKSANRDILEKLLAVNYEHLDGDGVLNCLREHLRVKPIDLSKSCLPDLHDVRQHRSLTWRETKLKMPDTSRETMPKMADKLSHLSAMKESISSKASTGDNKVTEGSISLKSPTQPRNLFASISSLARRTPQTIPVEDPFSALDMGSSPRWHSHQVEQVHNRADQDDAGKNSMVSAGSEPQGHGETNVAATCRDSLVSAANDTASSGESLGGNTNGVNAGNFNLDIVPEYNIETDTVHSNVDGNASRHLKDAVCTSATADEVFNTSGSGELQLNDSSIRQGENVTVYGESEPQGHGERSVAATCDDSQVSRATDSVPSGNSLRGCVEGVKAGDFSSNIVPEHDIENNTVDRSVDSNHTRVSEDAVCTIATSNPEEFLNEGNNALDSGELQGNQSSITQGEADAIPASTNDQPQYPCEENPELPEGTPNQRKKRKAPSKVTASRKKKANVSSNRCQKGQESNNQSAEVSSAFGAGDHGDIGEPSNTQDASLEKSSEGTPKPAPRQVKRKRENLRRKSLAAAGMQWESGVRRSTRIRMRPLEYWKGERVLYGRVHQSLVTVIGVKMSSPSESAIKVKSFISDEYKELVELAALH